MPSMLLQGMKDLAAPPHRKGTVIQDLEFALRAKGGLSPEEEAKLRVISLLPQTGFIFGSGLASFTGWFGPNIVNKFAGLPPIPRLPRFCFAAGLAYVTGKFAYFAFARECAAGILKSEDARIKMELANIILTDHSDDGPLVQAVKSQFFSEHLFDDLHQDKPLFRWHPRRSYVDSAYVERMKEIEAISSYDEAKSISRQKTSNVRSFGDLTEDPFACILGSPGVDMESDTPPEKTGTVLKRSELRARRRSHRHHHHRHADRLNVL